MNNNQSSNIIDFGQFLHGASTFGGPNEFLQFPGSDLSPPKRSGTSPNGISLLASTFANLITSEAQYHELLRKIELSAEKNDFARHLAANLKNVRLDDANAELLSLRKRAREAEDEGRKKGDGNKIQKIHGEEEEEEEEDEDEDEEDEDDEDESGDGSDIDNDSANAHGDANAAGDEAGRKAKFEAFFAKLQEEVQRNPANFAADDFKDLVSDPRRELEIIQDMEDEAERIARVKRLIDYKGTVSASTAYVVGGSISALLEEERAKLQNKRIGRTNPRYIEVCRRFGFMGTVGTQRLKFYELALEYPRLLRWTTTFSLNKFSKNATELKNKLDSLPPPQKNLWKNS